MNLISDPIESSLNDHIYFSKKPVVADKVLEWGCALTKTTQKNQDWPAY